MERYFGFDLGDAESAISVLKGMSPAVSQEAADGQTSSAGRSTEPPELLPVQGAKSFITAYARMEDGQILLGEGACYQSGAISRKLRFKSRFLTDPASVGDIRLFAGGVLEELEREGYVTRGEDACFYIGCPAGWDRTAREKYRQIFERCGYPPVRIISESRAALVSACQSRYLQVGYDILSRPVLVVDIGSSTTDFAYIMGGREVELQTGGEVRLGGGILDELVLEEAVAASADPFALRSWFSQNETWRSYCEFAARKLKETYYSDEDYWSAQPEGCSRTIRLIGAPLPRLTLRIDSETADRLLHGPATVLGKRSFSEVFLASLKEARDGIQGQQPELIFLTGGVSRMTQLQDWCRSVFPDSVVITAAEPEFSVCRGLAWCGQIDEEMRAFRREVENLRDSSTVEQIVGERINGLYRAAVDQLTDPILEQAVLPVIRMWRSGQIRTLAQIDERLQEEITAWLHSDAAHELLMKTVMTWLRPVSYALEEYTVPICVRHHIPYRSLSLNSYLSMSEVDFHIEAKSVFAVEEITWLIDTIITILVGLLCGGSGIALIANGLPGIMAGAVISFLLLFLGRERMQDALLQANIPVPMRRLLPMQHFESRIRRLSGQVKEDFYRTLENEKNEEITERLIRDISDQIESCLIKMAEVVQVPLG